MSRPAQSDCNGKARFISRKQAERAAARLAKREDCNMHVYPCAVCRGLHVGSTIMPKHEQRRRA